MPLKSLLSPHMVACAALVAAPLAASAATSASDSPPPGLYRFQTNSSIQNNSGALPPTILHQVRDSASGNAQLKGGIAGGALKTKNYAGNAANFCMPALPAGGAMPAKQGCKSSPAVAGAAGISYATDCGALKYSTTISKIDEKTWEYKVVSSQGAGAVAGSPDYAGMGPCSPQKLRTARRLPSAPRWPNCSA